MCGRFVQYEGMAVFMELGPQMSLFGGYDAEPISRYNVAPTPRVQILYSTKAGIHITPVRWG